MRLLLIALLPLLVAGCLGGGSYTTVRYYDLPAPEVKPVPPSQQLETTLRIGRFGTMGPYRTKFVSRISEHELSFDEYYRWAEPPSDLLAMQLYRVARQRGTFARVTPAHGTGVDLMARGDLLSFERLPDGAALAEAEITLANAAGEVLFTRVYRHSVPAQGETGESFVTAMAEAVNALCLQAVEDFAKAANTAD